MDPGLLFSNLFDKKKLAMIKLFLNNPDNEYYLREAAKLAKLSPATSLRILDLLEHNGVVTMRKIKKMKLYSLAKSKEASYLSEILSPRKSAIQEFVESASKVNGVVEIIQHGSKQKDKANMLIIGLNVDSSQVSKIVNTIKSNYGFSIIHLVLSPDQYGQMSSMGLYSGEKKILFP